MGQSYPSLHRQMYGHTHHMVRCAALGLMEEMELYELLDLDAEGEVDAKGISLGLTLIVNMIHLCLGMHAESKAIIHI